MFRRRTVTFVNYYLVNDVIQTLPDYQSVNQNIVGTADAYIFSHVPAAVTLIGFRICDPDKHTIKQAKDSFDANGGRSDTLVKFKYCEYLEDL
jgi:benzoyl-CoA reductase/2-hydroxyglutaryl-CoA dehydratase subunit BcrC/BadD/HgdB